jgi:predicted TIM-barrel fold metal-dependent hydrolase
MVLVDTHCHAATIWFQPVETLLDQMNRNGVDKAVLIQIRGLYDNSYLIECIRRFPGKFSGVAIVDIASPDAPERLERLVKEGIEGIRLHAKSRSPGRDPLAIWRKARELGISVSCQGGVSDFASEEFQAVFKELSDLKILLNTWEGAETIPLHPGMPTARCWLWPSTLMLI